MKKAIMEYLVKVTVKHITAPQQLYTTTKWEQHSVIHLEIQLCHHMTYAKYIMEISKAVEVWHRLPFLDASTQVKTNLLETDGARKNPALRHSQSLYVDVNPLVMLMLMKNMRISI